MENKRTMIKERTTQYFLKYIGETDVLFCELYKALKKRKVKIVYSTAWVSFLIINSFGRLSVRFG
jgi:hypothetical protein